MIFDTIKVWLFFNVPSNEKKSFELEVRHINLIRTKATALFFLVMEFIILPIFLINRESKLADYPNYIYTL